jgi:putative heme-binding domain-containing protein
VACYRHGQFPAAYRGGFFLADWTFGKVWFVNPEPSGATFTGTPKPFLEATGENGFAPTALAVHPETGELFVSIGGRGTRGAVYRVRATDGPAKPNPLATDVVSLGWADGDKARTLTAATTGAPTARRKALETAFRHREHFAPADLVALVGANADHDDRTVRQAASRLAARLPGVTDTALKAALKTPRAELTVWLGLDANPVAAVLKAAEIIENPKAPPDVRADATRLIALAAGDLTAKAATGNVFEGYTFKADLPGQGRQWAAAACRAALPSGDATLDRELARVLAALADEDPATPGKLAARLTPDSDPLADEHFLICLARLSAPLAKPDLERVATAFLALDRKLAKAGLYRDRHWPLRIGEAYATLAVQNPDLYAAAVNSPEFGRPDHMLFLPAAGELRAVAAKKFLEASKKPGFEWTPGVVAILGALPQDQIEPLLGPLWTRGGLEDAIVPLLSRSPKEADRAKFVAGLRSVSPVVVAFAAHALAQLPASDAETVPAVRALRRLGTDAATKPHRDYLAALLNKQTGQVLPPEAKPWEEWLAREKPAVAKQLAAATGYDPEAWAKRLAGVKWDAGDALAGKRVFAKASCAACHDGGQAVGPSLLGVAKRFGKDDLLAAVLDPNRDVSARYRTVRVTTDEDKVFEGIAIYEATDGVILQTGADTTVRIAGPKILDKKPGTQSLMPAGLLDPLTAAEIADLFAYLRSQ